MLHLRFILVGFAAGNGKVAKSAANLDKPGNYTLHALYYLWSSHEAGCSANLQLPYAVNSILSAGL